MVEMKYLVMDVEMPQEHFVRTKIDATALLSAALLLVAAVSATGCTQAATTTSPSSTTSTAGVANVTETCNDKAGYKVSLATTNGTTTGLFKGPSGNNDTLSYTATYNGASATFASGSVQVTNASARTAAGGEPTASAVP